ncbi:chloramphenicol phosphotransferase CPT [Kitasatospora viridis]|uniref:Chloramphenicol 3-O phosphotransferase n=1 Tax=Kitasatospora viridis TaxID=281105 RepID=A0A561UMZ9_9ACTN|nr:chloramphenicol phosphotransferase CPT [Kitasatospora viridis]TWG00741.1 chloramphenicol 3-O phosphotransferase [Kitasatospora viridis]
MTHRVIVLNGGSSTGKTTLARALQQVLPEAWLWIGVDAFVEALPPALQDSTEGLEVAADGAVTVGARFRELEAAWMAGVAAMVRAGAKVVIDEVFLGGAASQQRWARALDGLDVFWVGVRCDPATAAARELARGDRAPGMAAGQAELVHRGVRYDLEVDTTGDRPAAVAREIAERAGLLTLRRA